MKEVEKVIDLEKFNSNRRYRLAFKHKIVSELVSGVESFSFLARKHGVPDRTVRSFYEEALQQTGYFRILKEMGKKKKEDTDAPDLAKENEQLKKALESTMLKVEALETLIDVAEDQLNVGIRKKPESKRSK